MSMSSLEKHIFHLLTENNIYFEQEKTFKDLKQGLYRFDFWIPSKNIAIEVNGAQHYAYTKVFHKTKSDFLKGQERDRKKISYCLAHNIKLYCIPYWSIDSILSLNDLFNNEFLARSKFHNDQAWRIQKDREK